MATKRVQRYRGFTLEITYLPHYPDVEVEATREECVHFEGLQEETGVCWKTGLIKRRSGYCDEGERRDV